MDRLNLARLDSLCDFANRVVALREIHAGDRDQYTIGMRHDCDDAALDSILPMAEWEARRGRRSTFYLLHTAPWYDTMLRDKYVPQKLVSLGHEVGLHINWVPSWEKDGAEPGLTIERELERLRKVVAVHSVCGHGDDACYRTNLVNYSMFVESGAMRGRWNDYTDATGLPQNALMDFGLDFLAEFVPKGYYVSDSGDEWNEPLAQVAQNFPYEGGPLVILQHPDWYSARLFA